MAVGLGPLPTLHPVPGVCLGTTRAGIRKPDEPDLVVMELAAGTVATAVFTRNAFCAAPVVVAREHLGTASPRALVINTGNANAGTGEGGLADARATCAALAEQMGCRPEEVLPFSTGVIGESLPMERLLAGLPRAGAELREDGWASAADAIRTTDTVPKGASEVLAEGDGAVLTGIAKGSGMIRPDMATMLAFLATDWAIAPEVLDTALRAANAVSFNRITVDGDTSTNDAVTLISTGRAAAAPLNSTDDTRYPGFLAALTRQCRTLAQAVVRDGEGATRFVPVTVSGGRDEAECLEVAYTIAHSPLVKTALFAGDPNWGRILAAVGRAGVADLELAAVTIHLGSVCIVRDGGRAADYTEDRGGEVMAAEEIPIHVDLARGTASATVWTTDLSYDYVRINAEYRS
ncbi:MAG: bifunctional glutamate N-acetyltransferase/amino-acid acetyltransferase ArgJ [Pseudomonadota bacterium]